MVTLLAADKVVAVRVELQKRDRVGDAREKQPDLRPKETARMPQDGGGKPAEPPGKKTVWA